MKAPDDARIFLLALAAGFLLVLLAFCGCGTTRCCCCCRPVPAVVPPSDPLLDMR